MFLQYSTTSLVHHNPYRLPFPKFLTLKTNVTLSKGLTFVFLSIYVPTFIPCTFLPYFLRAVFVLAFFMSSSSYRSSILAFPFRVLRPSSASDNNRYIIAFFALHVYIFLLCVRGLPLPLFIPFLRLRR